jgi:uncharacterized membrane protein YcaP (DUF421 family)
MWFDTWSDVWRTVAIGTAAYVTLVAVLRTSGKRTLAKLNAFDLVVTVGRTPPGRGSPRWRRTRW